MVKNISFVGGIHGVGKSTICKNLCKELELEYLSASELIKWNTANNDIYNKKVKNVSSTEDILLTSLKNTISINKKYLLDGHYCLMNVNNDIINIPITTFRVINPISLNIIIGEIEETKYMLEQRDKKIYDIELLRRMQDSELSYAKKLSTALGISLTSGARIDYSEISSSLREYFQ